mgnify:CR=1 FL=1
MVAALIVTIYGFYAIWTMRYIGVRKSGVLEHAALVTIKQLLESPGNWSANPPVIGLAYSTGQGNSTLVYPYLIDPSKLNNLSNLSYSSLREGLPLGGLDIRIAIYFYNETSNSFPNSPNLFIGSGLIGENSATIRAYARLLNGGGQNTTLCEFQVTVWGGG